MFKDGPGQNQMDIEEMLNLRTPAANFVEPPSAWADHRQQLVPNITLCLGRFQDLEIDSSTKLA